MMTSMLTGVCRSSENQRMAVGIGDTPAETIGERLLRLRRERGLSQRQLASPDFTAAYISRIEAGARQPSVRALRKFAARLGVSAEYLETGSEFGGSRSREPPNSEPVSRYSALTPSLAANFRNARTEGCRAPASILEMYAAVKSGEASWRCESPRSRRRRSSRSPIVSAGVSPIPTA